jgi:hypothetical protein
MAMEMARKMGRRYLAWKQRLRAAAVFGVDGGDDVGELADPHSLADGQSIEDRARFLHAAFAHQPARAARDAEQHREEQECGNGRDAQLPAPFGGAERPQCRRR